MWNVIDCLERTISTAKDIRVKAQHQLERHAHKNWGDFITQMTKALSNPKHSSVARQSAGLQLKNCLTARDLSCKQKCQKRWCSLAADHRTKIRNHLVSTLGSETVHPSSAAQCLAYICSAELDTETTSSNEDCLTEVLVSLIDLLDSIVSKQNQKEAAMETIGFICQEVKPKILEKFSGAILSPIVNCLKDTKSSKRIRLTAAQALLSSLQFIASHFERKGDRNVIMQRVCDTTQSSVIEERVIALQILAKLPSYYYSYLADYMDNAIIPITFDAIACDDVNLSLQGMEFWCSIAEVERDLANGVYDPSYDVPDSRDFSNQVLPNLVPLLVTVLEKWQEDTGSLDDLDEWTPVKGAVACLSLLSECCSDVIDVYLLPEVKSRLKDVDWKRRIAAVWALSSVIEEIDIKVKVQPLMQPIWELTQDQESVKVRYAALMLQLRIFQTCPSMIPVRYGPLVRGLIHQLKDDPRAASIVCDTLSTLFTRVYQMNIVQIDGEEHLPETFPLSPYFEKTISRLLKYTEGRYDPILRSSAFNALKNILLNSPVDCLPLVRSTIVTLLPKFQKMIRGDEQSEDFQTQICTTLSNGFTRLESNDMKEIDAHIGRLRQEFMFNLIELLRSNVINESLIGAFSKILPSSLGADSEGHLMELFIHLKSSIKSPEVCPLNVALVSELFAALGLDSLKYLDDFCAGISLLLAQDIGLQLRTECMAAFNEMAVSLGLEHFQPYIGLILSELNRSCQIILSKIDDPYYEEFQEIILQGYGILFNFVHRLEIKNSDADQCQHFSSESLIHKCLEDVFHLIAGSVTEESSETIFASSGSVISVIIDKLGVIKTEKYLRDPYHLKWILTAVFDCNILVEYHDICQAALVILERAHPGEPSNSSSIPIKMKINV